MYNTTKHVSAWQTPTLQKLTRTTFERCHMRRKRCWCNAMVYLPLKCCLLLFIKHIQILGLHTGNCEFTSRSGQCIASRDGAVLKSAVQNIWVILQCTPTTITRSLIARLACFGYIGAQAGTFKYSSQVDHYTCNCQLAPSILVLPTLHITTIKKKNKGWNRLALSTTTLGLLPYHIKRMGQIRSANHHVGHHADHKKGWNRLMLPTTNT